MRNRTLVLLLGLVMILAACGGDEGEEVTTTTAAPVAEGGTVHIGWAGAPSSLNPGLGELTEDYVIVGITKTDEIDYTLTEASKMSYTRYVYDLGNQSLVPINGDTGGSRADFYIVFDF